MKKTFFAMSGIPRSGSTVLAAILNQNPETQVSTTSGLVNALDGLANTWHSAGLLDANDKDRSKLAKTMRGMIDAFYEDEPAPVIIDKSRGWSIPQITGAMNQVLGRPMKIVCTVRNVPDCAASFVRIAKPSDLDAFMANGQLMDHLRAAYISLQEGFNFAPDQMLFVDYDDLISDPQLQLDRIHEFLELAPFTYDLNAIDGSTVSEDDENLHGYAGMHDVKPKLERLHNEDARAILGYHYSKFQQPSFWKGEDAPNRELDLLDVQLAASTVGDFEEGEKLANQLEEERPSDHRAAYNRGWYRLRQGNIQEGYRLMDRGRIEGVFGNKMPDTPAPLWDGVSKGVILLNLEGGLGDQIHQVRYAKDIVAKGNKVVVACTGSVAALFIDVEGVSAVIQHEAIFGIYHDFWTPGMSVVVPLGFSLEDISGIPYITKPAYTANKKPRIGLRWSGNPRFESEQHRVFSPQLMFDAVKDIDADFISLQRDADTEVCPSWVKEVDLASWDHTRHAIASCDLIITSCTSVSHLAAAMGVETWVAQPIMPYYMYSMDIQDSNGFDVCPYYSSMKLFRQKTFGDWSEPFNEIKDRLAVRYPV